MKLKTLREWNDWKVVGIEPTNVQGKITDWGVQFLTEPYQNTVVAIGDISISDIDSSEEEGILSFTYELYHNPHNMTPETHPEFEQHIGDVVVSTLTTALDEGNAILNEREPEQDHTTITLDE